MIKKIVPLDDTENTLLLVPADIDGFHIKETEGDGKIYVYYSEIKDLIVNLKDIMEGGRKDG